MASTNLTQIDIVVSEI